MRLVFDRSNDQLSAAARELIAPYCQGSTAFVGCAHEGADRRLIRDYGAATTLVFNGTNTYRHRAPFCSS